MVNRTLCGFPHRYKSGGLTQVLMLLAQHSDIIIEEISVVLIHPV